MKKMPRLKLTDFTVFENNLYFYYRTNLYKGKTIRVRYFDNCEAHEFVDNLKLREGEQILFNSKDLKKKGKIKDRASPLKDSPPTFPAHKTIYPYQNCPHAKVKEVSDGQAIT